MDQAELRSMTLAVCDIAKSAGSYIKEQRAKFSLSQVERKHAHDYVSYVDKGSEEQIVSALRQLLPEAGFITEEGSAGHDQEQFVWVIDPLDGTTNFIHQYAPYAVSIALIQGRQIIIGVVYEICSDECYYAWQGGGAYVNDKPIHVSQQKIEAYKPTVRLFIDTFYGHCASIRMIGSAAMALCYVAAGRLDGYAEQYIGQWDYMAGGLIVMEAGGVVTDFSGSADFTQGNSVVATNGIIQQDILNAIV